MNWFEGGRRITKLFQGLVLAGSAAFLVFSSPYDTVTFETSWPNEPFKISNSDCYGSGDRSETRYNLPVLGKSLDADLCFRSDPAKNGERAIAYAPAPKDGFFLMGETYSEEVDRYIKMRSASFSPTGELARSALAVANKKWWDRKKSDARDAVTFAIVACVVLQLLAFVVGWIARGFAGIKSGTDYREPSES